MSERLAQHDAHPERTVTVPASRETSSFPFFDSNVSIGIHFPLRLFYFSFLLNLFSAAT